MIFIITTDAHYREALAVIETILAKGSANMTEPDLAKLQRLSLLAEKYEALHYPMPLDR